MDQGTRAWAIDMWFVRGCKGRCWDAVVLVIQSGALRLTA